MTTARADPYFAKKVSFFPFFKLTAKVREGKIRLQVDDQKVFSCVYNHLEKAGVLSDDLHL